jgi:hypothetical protein
MYQGWSDRDQEKSRLHYRIIRPLHRLDHHQPEAGHENTVSITTEPASAHPKIIGIVVATAEVTCGPHV